MIDIEEVLRMDRLEHIARAVHGRVEHDEEVGLYGSLQLRPANNIISRQHRKDGRNIIIEQNESFLAERAQDVHEAERRPDGVAVGVLVGRDDNPLSAGQDGCCFTQCHYHVNVLPSCRLRSLSTLSNRSSPCPRPRSSAAALGCARCSRGTCPRRRKAQA